VEIRRVFDRYNIVSETDLIEAARKIEEGANRDFGHSSGISGATGERIASEEGEPSMI